MKLIARSIFLLLVLSCSPLFATSDRIHVTPDFSEADAVLSILDKKAASQPVADTDWQKVFSAEPYQRLKKREAGMQRPFSDDDFRAFVLSDDLSKQRNDLARTVADWKSADLSASAARILPYLPAESTITAKVFPVIKPHHNSFVFEASTDPAIFLYVDPTKPRATFENTVAHEMHHIGLSSVDKQYEEKIASLPPAAHSVAQWMGAFGEGEAVLAAVGGPDAYPVGDPTPELKENWARGMRDFNQDLEKVNAFFLDALDGKLKGDAINQQAMEFFGLQGPWYTVGYKMAVLVEKHDGRPALIDCMRDRRLLLVRYNAIATELNRSGKEHLALWSPEIFQATNAPSK